MTNINTMEAENTPPRPTQAEDRYTELMLDSIPLLCSVWDEECNIVDCNLEALRLFGLRKKNDYISRFYELNPEFQSDGRPSRKKADDLIRRALETGFQRFEWEFQTPQGDRLPMSVLLIRVSWQGGYRILSYSRDLREIRKATARIDRQTKLLQTVNSIAINLMVSDMKAYSQTIKEQLRTLGIAIGADRVALWENRDLDGKRFARKIYEWNSDVRHSAETSFFFESFEYDKLPYLRDMVDGDRAINTAVEHLPQAERQSLEGTMVTALLMVPISHDGLSWGFIVLENFGRVQKYPDIDEQTLRSCGFLMVSAIIRNRATLSLLNTQNELIIHEKLLIAVNEVASMLLDKEESDFNHVLASCMRILAESVGAGRVSLWRNHEKDERIHSRCLFDWSKEEDAAINEGTGPAIDLETYIPEWNRQTAPHTDLDLPMYRMSAQVRESPFWRDAKSLLLMPLYIEGSFWGFFSFSYHNVERRFTQEERNILWSGSLNIASALVRKEIRENLAEEKIRATYDNLTRVENRHSFYPRGQKIFDEHKHKEMELTVLFLDIDHFKRVNDQYGHDFGDQVLVAFAGMLKKNTRPNDLLCRYGGEEFLLLMPHTGKEGGMALCQRIMEQVKELGFESQPSFSFTTSIGMMSGVPSFDEPFEDFIKKADEALYAAKHEGRNRVVMYQ